MRSLAVIESMLDDGSHRSLRARQLMRAVDHLCTVGGRDLGRLAVVGGHVHSIEDARSPGRSDAVRDERSPGKEPDVLAGHPFAASPGGDERQR